ncbi:MAG: nuclear transport factor 2 family protein [Phycisphaera sp.]|nr:nuclear transport factor 2 family protein [Phycisphaera sp.]
MSIQALANRVVEMCNARKNFEVMHTLYAPDIVSVEPTGQETTGKAEVIRKSERWAEGVTIHGETVLGPYFSGADQFATKTMFDVTRKATGERVQLNEITVYTVKDGLITREQFFFDGENW